MATLTHYEVAWNMHQAGSKMEHITAVVGRHRSTIFRWLAKIKQVGIKEFLRRKWGCKHRRPSARTPEWIVQLLIDLRQTYDWCGQKLRKELAERHSISLGLSTIYRWLHRRLTRQAVGVQRYHKHQALVSASAPREVIEHDTVDLGGLYAYTAIDIFTKEVSIFIGVDLTMETGAKAFAYHTQTFGWASLHQSDNGSEFQSAFVEAVEATGATHRYSRPYKKNEQAHIENFNKSLRRESLGKIHYPQSQQEEVGLQAKLYAQHFFAERWHLGLPNMMTPQ